jgi:hypothetical protein
MKIIQIIPATPGWYVHDWRDPSSKSNIALWALVEDEVGQRIIPLSEGHKPPTYAHHEMFEFECDLFMECRFSPNCGPLLKKGDK